MTTLRELHKKLKIKQTLDNYVRNTNKKYKYNFVFPTVEKVFIHNDNGSQAQAKQDLFGGAEPIEVNTEDLPF